jgi:hypothetical protein
MQYCETGEGACRIQAMTDHLVPSVIFGCARLGFFRRLYRVGTEDYFVCPHRHEEEIDIVLLFCSLPKMRKPAAACRMPEQTSTYV